MGNAEQYRFFAQFTASSTGETCKDWWSSWGLAATNVHSKLGVELSIGSTAVYN